MSYVTLGGLGEEPVAYEDFRSGLDFGAVREILSNEQDKAREAGQYMFVSRGTVLGRWHQLKRAMYTAYLEALREEGDRPWLAFDMSEAEWRAMEGEGLGIYPASASWRLALG